MKNGISSLLTFGVVTSMAGAALDFDLTRYQRQSGLEARVENEALVVQWRGEVGQQLRAQFAMADGVPTVRELAVRSMAGQWSALGRNLKPVFGVTTGIRR